MKPAGLCAGQRSVIRDTASPHCSTVASSSHEFLCLGCNCSIAAEDAPGCSSKVTTIGTRWSFQVSDGFLGVDEEANVEDFRRTMGPQDIREFSLNTQNDLSTDRKCVCGMMNVGVHSKLFHHRYRAIGQSQGNHT